jgi:hypothetical protein
MEARSMTIIFGEEIAGFEAPVHRSLTELILLAGAPRAVAIINGTVSAALGLGLRLWICRAGFFVESKPSPGTRTDALKAITKEPPTGATLASAAMAR